VFPESLDNLPAELAVDACSNNFVLRAVVGILGHERIEIVVEIGDFGAFGQNDAEIPPAPAELGMVLLLILGK
jgi:hypothetical protein